MGRNPMIEVVTKYINWYSSASEQGVNIKSYGTMTYEEPLPIISADNKRGSDSSDQNISGWLSLIKEELFSIPLVEDIFVSIDDSDVDVWVVIPKRDISILHQIVEREWELLKILVSGESPPFLVDFHIIYRCGRNIDDLAPTRTIRLSR